MSLGHTYMFLGHIYVSETRIYVSGTHIYVSGTNIYVSRTCHNSGPRSPFHTLTSALDMIFQAAPVEHAFRATALPNKPVLDKKQIRDGAKRSRGSGCGSPWEKAQGLGGGTPPNGPTTRKILKLIEKQK